MKKFIPLLLLIVFLMHSYAQWEKCSKGLYGGCVRALLISDNKIYAGLQYGGLYLSTNNGDLWMQLENGLSDTQIYSLAKNENFIFAGTLDSGIFISSDNGESWYQHGTTLKNTYIESIAISGNYIYASSSEGVFTSTNNGENWSIKSNGMTSDYNVISVAASGNNIYSSTEKWGIFISTDYGNSWEPKNTGIRGGLGLMDQIFSFAIIDNFVFAGGSVVYVTTDKGDQWIQKDNGLNVQVKALIVIDKNIFAGSYVLGVYLSTNYGDNWNIAGYGLTSTMIYSLAVNNEYIFAGTYDGGICRAKLSDLITEVEAEEYKNEQYGFMPNPVSDKLTIHSKYNINSNYEIINLLGIKLLTGELSGEKTTVITSQLPQGMYFLKIGNEVRKVVKE